MVSTPPVVKDPLLGLDCDTTREAPLLVQEVEELLEEDLEQQQQED